MLVIDQGRPVFWQLDFHMNATGPNRLLHAWLKMFQHFTVLYCAKGD